MKQSKTPTKGIDKTCVFGTPKSWWCKTHKAYHSKFTPLPHSSGECKCKQFRNDGVCEHLGNISPLKEGRPRLNRGREEECTCCCHKDAHMCDVDTWDCEHCSPKDTSPSTIAQGNNKAFVPISKIEIRAVGMDVILKEKINEIIDRFNSLLEEGQR